MPLLHRLFCSQLTIRNQQEGFLFAIFLTLLLCFFFDLIQIFEASPASALNMDFVGNTLLPLIGEQVNHHRSLDENMNKLKRKCEELNCRKVDVESKMATQVKPGKKLKKEVEFWLAMVQRINDKTQRIEIEVGEERYLERSRLGKLIAEMIHEVEELHQKGSFSDDLVVDALPRNGEMLPTTTLTGETTIKKNMEEIWDCLIDDKIKLIGVYGMGGIGKTTVMKHVNNRLLKETDKFDNVIWVTVSKVLDVIKLQDAIARALNRDLSSHDDETIRAAKLFDMLRGKKRYVLILDDVWEAFQLENVGIPEPTSANGCKLVLTTRSLDVCRSMNCKGVKLKLLSKEEAWNLFVDKVGCNVFLTPSLEAIMKLVAKECACLPLAIITIARSMMGVVEECEWRNALEELRESTGGLNDMWKVLKQLKYSYIRLKDVKLQRCLLYCALYPEDFEIRRKELIEYLIVEGIIEGTSRQAKFDKAHSMLNKLENACLLESVTNYLNFKCVKMHDLIRDMAIQTMGQGCMLKAGVGLRNLPDLEKWTKNLERVSLMLNDIREICPGESPRCSRLSTLLLSGNGGLRSIPSSFFLQMHDLKVLDISYTLITTLPNSISDLENLVALFLRGCHRLKSVPSLAKLRLLRMLDLHWTRIEEVPHGMEMLVNLRCLNLYAEDLKMLPARLLPKLSRLQRLIVYWNSETLKLKGEDVAGLRTLETFAGQFYDWHDFNTYVRTLLVQGPRKYLLQVGSSDHSINFDEERSPFSKCVILRKCRISKGCDDPVVLPKDVEFLEIKEFHDARSLCDVSLCNNATNFLKCCKIINCDGMECLLLPSSSSSSYYTPLQSLEELELTDLQNLRILFRGGASPPPLGTFSCLKNLCIEKCPNIKKLFTLGLLPHLQNLERIQVRKCEGIEEIIAAEAGGEEEEQEMGESSNHSFVRDDDTIFTITLPKLRFLALHSLPKLKSIICGRGMMVCDSLHEIFIRCCPKLKSLSLSLPMINGKLSPPAALQTIWVDRKCWEVLEWDHPNTKDVLQPFL